MLARTAADNSAFTWLNMKMYAVCSKLSPRIQAIAPKRGPRWAEAVGRSSESLEEVPRNRPVNSFRASTAAPGDSDGRA
jgi:hypothetical protein